MNLSNFSKKICGGTKAKTQTNPMMPFTHTLHIQQPTPQKGADGKFKFNEHKKDNFFKHLKFKK